MIDAAGPGAGSERGAGPGRLAAMVQPTLEQLSAAVRASWDRKTSDTPDRYDPGNPARDQCGPTSLVVHDSLGGDLYEVEVFTGGVRTDHHYWNRLPDGTEVDLTRTQFRNGETFGPAIVLPRPTHVSPAAQARYELLATRVLGALEPPTRVDHGQIAHVDQGNGAIRP